jgi:hypothetical protein
MCKKAAHIDLFGMMPQKKALYMVGMSIFETALSVYCCTPLQPHLFSITNISEHYVRAWEYTDVRQKYGSTTHCTITSSTLIIHVFRTVNEKIFMPS